MLELFRNNWGIISGLVIGGTAAFIAADPLASYLSEAGVQLFGIGVDHPAIISKWTELTLCTGMILGGFVGQTTQKTLGRGKNGATKRELIK